MTLTDTFRSRSRKLLTLVGAAALALAALATAYLLGESTTLRESHLARLSLYARALDDQTASVISAADAAMESLAYTMALGGTLAEARTNEELLRSSLHGRRFLRSISLLDTQGLVLASTSAGNVGVRVPLAALGSTEQAGEQARLGPLGWGRDLADLAQATAARAPVTLLPMVQKLAVGERELLLVALINPDFIATQFERQLKTTEIEALLLSYEGELIAASSKVAAAAGTSLRQLPAFSQYLPQLESGQDIGAGANQSRTLMAFRVTRQWPLVVLVEEPYEVYFDALLRSARWAGLFLFSAWLLLGAGCWQALRALRRDEEQRRALLQAHAATQESESRKLAVLQSALDAIVTIDRQGRITDFNSAAERIFGYAAQQALGQTMHELIVPPAFRAAHAAGMQRYRAGGASNVLNRRIEIEAQHADGHVFPVELSIVPMQTSAGEFFTATLRDISARRAAEAELSAARQRELEVGAHVQRSLLVTRPPTDFHGLAISAHSQASQGIDGDFTEFIRIGVDCLDVIVGDVMGKGLAAAMMGAATKLQFSRSVAEVLGQARNQGMLPEPCEIVAAVHRSMTPTLQALDAFVTLSYLRVDLARHRLSWVACGHEETLLARAGLEAPLVLGNQHPPLGVLSEQQFQQDSITLQDGDLLFLSSDGLSDALLGDGSHLGREAVAEALQRLAALHPSSTAVLHAMRRELLPEGVQVKDDLTLLAMRVGDQDLALIRRIELPLALEALRPLRSFVLQQAERCGLDEASAGLLEVASVEAFTNILRHSTGRLADAPVELCARFESDALVLEFVYFADEYQLPESPGLPDLQAYPEGGFGLSIIHAACDRVEQTHRDGVNTLRLHKQR